MAYRSGRRQTVPPAVTTVTEKRSLPTPDGVSNAAAARSFVETHERRTVYNELTHSGDATVRTLYPDDAVGLPASSLCTRTG